MIRQSKSVPIVWAARKTLSKQAVGVKLAWLNYYSYESLPIYTTYRTMKIYHICIIRSPDRYIGDVYRRFATDRTIDTANTVVAAKITTFPSYFVQYTSYSILSGRGRGGVRRVSVKWAETAHGQVVH